MNQKDHNYYNIITIDNITYDISFDDNTLNDNTYINCKSIIFTNSTTKKLNNPELYTINFIDILHYNDLLNNNIQDLDIKNKIIKNFFYSTNNTYNFSSIILINKELLLDLFSFFKNINLSEYNNYENKNILIKVYEDMLNYYINLCEQDNIIKNMNKINNTSKLNIPLILRLKLALQYKSIILQEYKISLMSELLNKIETINNDFLKSLEENKELIKDN